ncbi:MAG: hypothetical protein WC602_07055 [archaeon]
MKIKTLTAVILLGILIPALAMGQGIWQRPSAVPSSGSSALLSNLKFAQTETDTFVFNYEKSPGLAFVLSAVLPGAGEFYAGAKWRAAAFFGVEAFCWSMYFNRQSTGKDIEKQYKKYADDNWNLFRWFDNCQNGSELEQDYFGLGGSHNIRVYYNGTEYIVNDSLSLKVPEYWFLAKTGEMTPVKDRDYYENIGKYDQFGNGWKDYDISLIDTTLENPLKTSAKREKYLTQRYNSNQALKMATNFATAIMFNHLFSAFHAQIAAKHYRSEGKNDVSWNMGFVADVTYRQPIRGLMLMVNF